MDLKKIKEVLGREFSYNAKILNEVIQSLKLEKDANILDIGTGLGVMSIMLASHGYKVLTGEPEGHKWADWRSSAQKVGVEEFINFKPFRAEALPFSREKFDAIFMYGSFHHIGEKELALKECIRVLKPTGTLILIEFTPEGIEQIRKRFPSHPDAVDPRDYTKDLPLSLEIIGGGVINAYIFKKIYDNR